MLRLVNFGVGIVVIVTVLFQYVRRISANTHSQETAVELDNSLVLTKALPSFYDGFFTLIGTVDGNLHAIDGNNQRIWTLPTGGPLVRGGSVGNPDDEGKSERIIPSLDGSLLAHNTVGGMRKTSVTARFLAEKSPFVSQDGVAFSGSKQDNILGLDFTNGAMVFDRSGVHGSMLKVAGKRKTNPLFIGREDFTVRGHDSRTGFELFNLSYSELHPLLEGGSFDFEVGDSSDLKSAVLSTPEGFLYFMDDTGAILNDTPITLQSPAVNAFTVHVQNGEAVGIQRLAVRHNLNTLRHSLKLSMPHNAVATQRQIASNQRSGSNRPRLLPGSSTSDVTDEELALLEHVGQDGKLVLVQSATGGEDSDNFYAMEISIPSALVSAAPLLAPEQNPLALLATSKETDDRIEHEQDLIVLETVVEELPEECEGIMSLEAEGLEKLHSSSPLLLARSKSTVLNVRQKISSLGVEKQQVTTRCSVKKPSSRPLKEDAKLDRVVADDRDDEEEANTALRLARGVNRIRGMHKLRPGELDSAFWMPKFQKQHQQQQQQDVVPREEGTRSSPYGRQSILQPPLSSETANATSLFHVFLYLASGMLLIIFLLIVSIATVLYRLPRHSSLQEQAETVQILVRLLGASSVYLQHLFEDLFPDFHPQFRPQPDLAATSLVPAAVPNPSSNDVKEVVDEFGVKMLQVGALCVYPDSVLGLGSHGTVVFTGTLHRRPVAVKRMLSILHKSAEREISLLIKSDGHPNVVRYFIKEERNDFIYLGLQLCIMSVREYVSKLQQEMLRVESNARRSKQKEASASLTADAERRELDTEEEVQMSPYGSLAAVAAEDHHIPDAVRRSMLDVAEGLAYLHTQRIVHRDIKPHNILCALKDEHRHTPEDVLSRHGQSGHSSESPNENSSWRRASEVKSLAQLGDYVLKISDMGLSKQLGRDEHSFSAAAHSLSLLDRARQQKHNQSSHLAGENDEAAQDEVGTVGWQAPELITGRYQHFAAEFSSSVNAHENRSNHATDDVDELQSPPLTQEQRRRRRTLNVDVFSLGCVYYYLLTSGGHPFGAWYERENNIAQHKQDLSLLETKHPDAAELIDWMLRPDPEERPSSAQVTGHPFFWPAAKRLEFLTEFSDLLEKQAPEAAAVLALEAGAKNVFRGSWDRLLDIELLQDMGRFRKYDARSLRDLLRVIRNKRHHYHELPEALKARIRGLPLGYCLYFEARFPRLLLHCVAVAVRFFGTEKLLDPWLSKLQTRKHYLNNSISSSSSASTSTGGSASTSAKTVDTAVPVVSTTLSASAPVFAPGSMMVPAHVVSSTPVTSTKTPTTPSSASTAPQGSTAGVRPPPAFPEVPSSATASEPHSALPASATAAASLLDSVAEDNAAVEPAHINSDGALPKVDIPLEELDTSSHLEQERSSEAVVLGDGVDLLVEDVVAETKTSASEATVYPEEGGVRNDSAIDTATSSMDQMAEVISPDADANAAGTPTSSSSTATAVIPSDLQHVVVWQGGALQSALGCKGWWRDAADWAQSSPAFAGRAQPGTKRTRASHLTKAAADFKYRTRLCSHWETSAASLCPMRKKGKCTFAHGPLELRVKDTRRDKWPVTELATRESREGAAGEMASPSLKASGGEDVLSAARGMEVGRPSDAAGSANPYISGGGGGYHGTGLHAPLPPPPPPQMMYPGAPMMYGYYAPPHVYPPYAPPPLYTTNLQAPLRHLTAHNNSSHSMSSSAAASANRNQENSTL